MPNKKRSDLTYADVTPKGVYMGRRNFLLGLARHGCRGAKATKSCLIFRLHPPPETSL